MVLMVSTVSCEQVNGVIKLGSDTLDIFLKVDLTFPFLEHFSFSKLCRRGHLGLIARSLRLLLVPYTLIKSSWSRSYT